MKKVILLIMTTLLVVTLFLVGCTEKAPSSSAPASSVPESNLKKDFIIGWQPNTLQPPWAERLKAAELRLAEVNEELETNGTLMVKAPEKHGNIVEQSAIFDDFIASKVDIIIGIAADPESYAGLAKRGADAGVPVAVMVETSDIPNVVYKITQDEEEAGRMLGEKMVKDLGEEFNLVFMHGGREHSVDIGRTNGLMSVFNQYPGIKILAEQEGGWSQEPASKVMDDWIVAYGDEIDAVVTLNDNMSLGCIAAAKAAGKNYPTYGLDGTAEAIQAIIAGDYVATMDSDFTIFGRYMIDSAIDYIMNGETKDWYIPNAVIDSSNAEDCLERYRKTMAGEITW